MDFTYLLELAKNNEQRSKDDKSFKFSTKIPNAKREKKPGPNASAVSQVLSKIENEKIKKQEEYIKKKTGLLALRADNKHSKKRIRSLINRTKGASKAVLDDAKDLTTAKGEVQCDEDDYGYESTISQQIFSKLQNKYSTIPEDERLKFNKTAKSNIEDIKKRVMSSLKQKQEEDLGIRKRKRKRKLAEDDGFINDGDEYDDYSEVSKAKESEPEVKEKSSKKMPPPNLNLTNYKSDKYSNFKYEKAKEDKYPPVKEREKNEKKKSTSKPAPPPMSFEELMKVAQRKQAMPTPMVDPLQELEKKKKKKDALREEERPLTAKEKKEQEEDMLRKQKKTGKLPPEKEKVKSKPLNNKAPPAKPETGKENKEKKQAAPILEKALKTSIKSKALSHTPPSVASKTSNNSLKSSSSASSHHTSSSIESKSTLPPPKPQPPAGTDRKIEPKYVPSENNRKHIASVNSLQNGRKLQEARKSLVENNRKPPLSKVKDDRRLSKPSPVPSRKFPPPYFPTKAPQASAKRRIDSESEDEYDSEMDDFIDDDDAEIDYSSEIAKMFKYDKSKYREIDDDIDDMEVSFSQVEKEEKYSARIGLLEDLEDIKREEEEIKRKKVLKKRKP